MSIKINYSNKVSSKSSANLVLFTDEKFSTIKSKKFTALTVQAMAVKANKTVRNVFIISLEKYL